MGSPLQFLMNPKRKWEHAGGKSNLPGVSDPGIAADGFIVAGKQIVGAQEAGPARRAATLKPTATSPMV